MYFYEKPLQDLTDEEWEQICMKCGKCCMCKYSEGEVVHFSNQMCQYFDLKKGMCSCYNSRFDKARGECKKVSMELLQNNLELLPPSCAYRRLYEGRGLPPYHPLLTGNPQSVVKAKQTVCTMPVFSETAEDDSLVNLMTTALKNGWSEDKIRQEVFRIRKKFRLKWLETYPFPTKEKPTV